MIQLKNLLDLSAPPTAIFLIRVDFNVPIEKGVVLDDTKIRLSIPTLNFLLERFPEGKLVLMSHLGRPVGPDSKYSLEPVAHHLARLVNVEVAFSEEVVGREARKKVQDMKPGTILLLENLRFYKGEQEGDFSFAENLSELGDIYINEAFAVSHRLDASVTLVPENFKNDSYPGFCLNNEIVLLNSIFLKPSRPFVAIIGGAKLSTKLPYLKGLLEKADTVLVGGLMAYTLLKARGEDVGATKVEEAFLDEAKRLVKHEKLVLPVDQICQKELRNIQSSQFPIPPNFAAKDIGPDTCSLFLSYLNEAKTIFWCGPLGRFEEPPFDQGSLRILKKLAQIKKAQKVGGGGDTIHMIETLQQKDSFTRLTTGGGATIEFIEAKDFPAFRYLKKKPLYL